MLHHGITVKQNLLRSEVRRPRSHHQISAPQRCNNIHRRVIARFHLGRIKVDHHTAITSTNYYGRNATRNSAEHVAHIDARNVLLARIVHGKVGHRENANRHGAGCIKRQRHWRQRVGRKIWQRTQRQRVGQRQRLIWINVVAEIHLDNTDSRNRARLNKPCARRLIHPSLNAIGDGLLNR